MYMMTDEQRKEMQKVKIKQAIRKLSEIEAKQSGLINGNFSAVAKNHGLKVKVLRHYWDKAKEKGLV